MLNMYRDIFSGWSGTGFEANLVDFQRRDLGFPRFGIDGENPVQCGLVSIFRSSIKNIYILKY